MIINLLDAPIVQEFDAMRDLRNTLKVDDKHYKNNFRLMLEQLNNQQENDDFEAVLLQSDTLYKNLIDSVKTQDDYNDAYKKVFDVKAVAFILQFDMKTYAEMTEYYIKRIEQSNFFCPICGKELGDEYVDSLRQDADEHRKLEWFYGEYCQRRMKDCKRLRDIAQKKNFDILAWQIGIADGKPISMRQYISSKDNYHSEFEEIQRNRFEEIEKTEKRTAEEMALEWLRQKKAAGFKFGSKAS